MELYASSVNTRTNEVVTLLTMISTIFIPLGFIVGFYGMNFDYRASPYNMPELHWRYGYPFALGLMAVTTVALMLFFRGRGWVGSTKPRRPTKRAAEESAEGGPGGEE
jgi:magnesium transporter